MALYRRYRPETFAEVIGQEHVTEPLSQAIRNGRVNHAYLFSGPRGCGKTTSARILARALNCEQGPTPEPCGTCQSCKDLARGGSGGIDVIEIDAASHGGVDDARDLRERAAFAPASSRYKIYIIDEAHMVTTQGFNALLKVVEEPPEHLKFIFATTEPEKVLPTIRSRTHHYPFRLVAPSVLRDYLGKLCASENVPVDPAVLPLVVRAGAGSVRDSLSVLDQLMAGAGGEGLTLPRATALLGYTDAALLDEVVDAFAAHDGATVFALVERVIEAGHDPRRFVADLLDRLRDLVILAAVPGTDVTGMIDAPADAVERMRAQASRFSTADLSRAADLVNAGLTEMRGATAPRLLLELICARVLLPGAGTAADNDNFRDLTVRLDRVERQLLAGGAPAAAHPPAPAAAPAPPAPRPEPVAAESPRPAADRPATPAPRAASEPLVAAVPPPPSVPAPAAPTGSPDVATLRRFWPDILNEVKTTRRFAWMLLAEQVQVVSVDGDTLVLAFAEEGKRKNFLSGSVEILVEAIKKVLKTTYRIDAVLDPARATGPTPPPAGPAHATTPPPAPAPAPPPAAVAPAPAPPPPAAAPPAAAGEARAAAQQAAAGAPRTAPVEETARVADDEASPDDETMDDSGLSASDLLAREFGATVLEEIQHD
ncbi:MAG: DNA polymerase III subunit gamma and tau [Sporichthyaceae bacterium]